MDKMMQTTSLPQKPNKNQELLTIGIPFAIIVGLLCLGLCCVIVVLVTTFQPTDSSTSTSTTCPDVPPEWNIVISEQFNSNRNGWQEESEQNEYGFTQAAFERSKYVIQINPITAMQFFQAPDLPMQDDFYLTVEAAKTQGPEDSFYGVYFRMTDNHYYYFVISDTQEYGVLLLMQGWQHLVDWTLSPAIHPNETNKLTVLAEGDHFVFCINDQWVNEIYDDQKTIGYLGVTVGVENGGYETIFEFDKFTVHAPAK